MFMHRVILVLLEEGVCYDQCILLAKLCEPLPCFILYSEAKLACYSRYLLTSCFCIPVPCDEKNICFGYQIQNVLQVFIEPFNFSFFSITGWGIDLDYCDIEWLAFDCRSQQTVEILKEIGIPNHLTFLLRNLYAGEEAAVKTGHGTMDGFKLEKEYVKPIYCHPVCLTYMQRTSCEMLGWMNPKLESSFPRSGSFQMSQFFASGGQSIGASASVLPMNIHS